MPQGQSALFDGRLGPSETSFFALLATVIPIDLVGTPEPDNSI